MKKILYLVVALLMGVSCRGDDKSLESPGARRTEKIAPKMAVEKQSFKEAVSILCSSPQKVDLGDTEKGLAYLQEHLRNVEVKMEFDSFALISEKERYQGLAKLALRAGISDCALEKKWTPRLPKEELPTLNIPFEDVYLGSHVLRVNRINNSNTKGKAEITREGDTLILNAKIRKGSYHLELTGKVIPRSEKEFVLDGRLTGNPDLSWMNVVRKQDTRGRFLFKATKRRKYWRLYRVDGAKCACGESCGNDFCYIDISFKK